MVKITYVEATGTEHPVDVKSGISVMEGAVKNNVPGIDAVCGGACTCATCRVYVDQSWQEKVGKPLPMEQAMIDFLEERHPQIRLSCQILVTEALDGLVVRMPESQQ